MRPFADIYAEAALKKGGGDALEAILAETPVRPAAAVATVRDDRVLSEMTRRIFHAGLSWKMIDAKWPAFEEAFRHFDPHACAFLSDEEIETLAGNRAIVRNGAKIQAVRVNARFVLDAAVSHGSAARFFAEWPDADYVGLLAVLKARASHLGGDAAGRFLRAIGKAAFVTSPDMVRGLIRERVLAKPPGGKRDLAAIQAAFNDWSAESGRDLTVISRVLAISA